MPVAPAVRRSPIFLAFALATVFASGALASGADGTWYGVPTWPPPSPAIRNRIGHTIVFDPLHQKFVAFGGFGPGYSNEVWAHSISGNEPWVREIVVGAPPPERAYHSAVFDPVGHRMLVFGGIYDDGASATLRNDLWQLDLSTTSPTWSPVVATGTPPSPRFGHTSVFDPVRRRMLLFGGATDLTPQGPYNLPVSSNETWFLDCTTSPPSWQLATIDGAPPDGRFYHCAVFDPEADGMVIYGGYGLQFDLHDVWTLSMSTLAWTPRGSGGIDVPVGLGAAYEPVGHRMFVTNGELWSLDLDSFVWTLWGSDPGNTRPWGAFALDSSGHHGIFHGGTGWDIPPEDTWLLTVEDEPVWSSARPFAERYGVAGVYDPPRDRYLMFGGRSDAGLLGDILELEIGRDSSWIQVMPSALFGPRVGMGAVYDPARDRVVLFGGNNGANLNDIWLIGLSPPITVAQPAASGVPPAGRNDFSEIYDPLRDRIVIYGGNASGLLGDIWALNLSPTLSWTLLTPAPGAAPGPRRGHRAIYDPNGDRMLVFGGFDGAGARNDLWALSLAGTPAWTLLTPAGTPPSPRYAFSFELDPNRHRGILFGGTAYTYPAWNDVWALDLGTPQTAWHPLSPGGPTPLPRDYPLAVFDPIHDCMLVSGGLDHGFTHQDVWRLQFGDVPVATVLALLSSEARSDEVVLKWGLSGDAATDAQLERRDATSEWRTIATGPTSGSFVTFHDRDVVAGARYAYRLIAIAGTGTSTSAEVWIDVPAGPQFSLAGFAPNPAGATALRVAFSLSERAAATLEVVDVSGRRVMSRRIESPTPGAQTIVLAPEGELAPGLYFVKLTQAGRTLVARGSVVR